MDRFAQQKPKRLIVDAQVHIWAADSPERPWPPIVDPQRSRPHRPQPITTQDMLREMNAAGVDRAVIAPPVWEGVRNDLALAAAKKYPDKFAVMGRVDLNNPASKDLLPTWKQQPGMLGLRYALGRPLVRPLLIEGRIDWLWPAAEAAGLPLVLAGLLGAVPHKGSGTSEIEMLRAVRRLAAMNVSSGRHFARGQRAFFFALAYLGWFISPWLLIATSVAVAIVLWRRRWRWYAYVGSFVPPDAHGHFG